MVSYLAAVVFQGNLNESSFLLLSNFVTWKLKILTSFQNLTISYNENHLIYEEGTTQSLALRSILKGSWCLRGGTYAWKAFRVNVNFWNAKAFLLTETIFSSKSHLQLMRAF